MNERINYIYNLIEQFKYVTPSMVATQFKFPTARNKVQQIMGQMAQDKIVQRFRVGKGEYIYHLGKSKKWKHWLELARFHFNLLSELKQWQRIIYYEHEIRYPFGIADGFYIVQTTINKDAVMFFVEIDDGNNTFDKVKKYLAYYRSNTWKAEWWGQSFPLVLVITPRVQEIKLLVHRNQAEIIFRVVDESKNIISSLRMSRV